MIYIYNDYGGTHTCSLAAAYHLNQLPTNRVLTEEEILNVDLFNKLTNKDFGHLIFRGMDEEDNPVYTIGRRNQHFVVPAMETLSIAFQKQCNLDERIVFSNTSPTVPPPLTLGGLFSRGLKLDFIGVPLLVKGAKQCCLNIKKLVDNTKRIAKSTEDKVIVLNNEEFQI